MPRSGETGYFINSLRRLAPDNYELLRSTLLQLLPDIEDFEPVQVDLSERADVPFQVPNTYYDIRVKERANNQYTSINSVSTGCKKILYVLTMALAGDTKVITTSHSPFLVKYLRTERIYLGLPTKEGVADLTSSSSDATRPSECEHSWLSLLPRFLLRQAAARPLVACYHRDARKPSGATNIVETKIISYD